MGKNQVPAQNFSKAIALTIIHSSKAVNKIMRKKKKDTLLFFLNTFLFITCVQWVRLTPT